MSDAAVSPLGEDAALAALRDVRILLDDPPIMVFWKPAGLATQAPPGCDSLVVRVKEYLKLRFDKPGNVYLGVPHRLDRPVAGAVVLARNSKAARRLAEQFRDRQVKKTYLAVIEAPLAPGEGSLVHRLVKEEGSTLAKIVGPERADAKECMLRYRTLGQTASGAVLEVELGTGRYHQIRVQLSAEGRPILGDAAYGSTATWPQGAARNESEPDGRSGSIALFAWRLEVFHPVRFDLVAATAPLPTDWPADVHALVADAASKPKTTTGGLSSAE